MRALVAAMLDPLQGPVEFEAETGYPGAPKSKLDAGGLTPRRLLHAYSRDALLRAWARDPRVGTPDGVCSAAARRCCRNVITTAS